ncbi:hypothetical protein EPO05_00180 [Patescibacteria group bacterium]|nr:MAG: hypothetical protein EPO05_00180 [Patescibacteria group bacterium]
MGTLEQHIIATITYYNEMSYPLTAFEVWRNMLEYQIGPNGAVPNNWTLVSVMEALNNGVVQRYVDEYRGFYFLKGRKKLVRGRILRNKIAVGKTKKLLKLVRCLQGVPFVRMIAVTGRLAMKSAQGRSDWDLLVVLKTGRIWIGRTLVTLIVWALGKRRTDKRSRDRACLNYFLTDQSLEIGTKDYFAASEYSFIRPVFGWNVFQQFQLVNGWISRYHSNYHLADVSDRQVLQDSRLTKFVRGWGERLFDHESLEAWLRRIERKKIANNPKTEIAGGLIEATDQALVFLPLPQGPKVFERFKERLNSLRIR